MVPSSVVRRVETWVVPAVLVGAVVAALGQGGAVVGAQSPGTGEVLRECQSALWKRTFDEATAAGLNPGAMPVTFEARKATTTKRNGKLIATGTESYRPTPHTDAFDVRYECVTDLATGKVESVTYAAVDATGALSTKAPTTIVRERLMVSAELSSQTFWTSAREFSSFSAATGDPFQHWRLRAEWRRPAV